MAATCNCESFMCCQRLIEKLKQYGNEIDEYKTLINESNERQSKVNQLVEANVKQLIDQLNDLNCKFDQLQNFNTNNNNNNTNNNDTNFNNNTNYYNNINTNNNMKLLFNDFIHNVFDNVKSLYKNVALQQQQQRYETDLNDSVNNFLNRFKNLADFGERDTAPNINYNLVTLNKFNLVLNSDMNEFKIKTTNVIEKLGKQKKMLQTLLSEMQMKVNVTSTATTTTTPLTSVSGLSTSDDGISRTPSTSSCGSSTPSSTRTPCSSTCNSMPSSTPLSTHSQQPLPVPLKPHKLAMLLTDHKIVPDTYICPKCQISIETSKISMKKYETHVRKCDSETKLICMFCLKLFDKSEQALYENHVQKHLIKESLAKSPITTVSSFNFQENTTNNNSKGETTPSSLNDSTSRSTSSSTASNVYVETSPPDTQPH